MNYLECTGFDCRFDSRPFDHLVHPVWAGSRLLVVPRALAPGRNAAQRQSMDIGQNDDSIGYETSGNEKKLTTSIDRRRSGRSLSINQRVKS